MWKAGTHENAVSGKLVTSVTAVDRVAEVDRSLFWKRAVGDCPEVTLEITGVEIKACYDTGSQCTLMTESCYRESLGGQLNLRNMDSCRWLSLSAANGMEIQRLGYLMTDVKVCEETVKDVVVIVIRDPTVRRPKQQMHPGDECHLSTIKTTVSLGTSPTGDMPRKKLQRRG